MEDNERQVKITEDGIDNATRVKVVAASVAALAFLVFALQNTSGVEVTFLFWDFQMRRIVLMLLSAVIGIGASELGRFIWRRRSAKN